MATRLGRLERFCALGAWAGGGVGRSTQELAALRRVLIVLMSFAAAGCATQYGNGPDGYRYWSEDDAYKDFERRIHGEPEPHSLGDSNGSGFIFRFDNGIPAYPDRRFEILLDYRGDVVEANYIELTGALYVVLYLAWDRGLHTDRQIEAEIVAERVRVTSDACPQIRTFLNDLTALVTTTAATVTVGVVERVYIDSPRVWRYTVGDGYARSTTVSETELESDLYLMTMAAIEYTRECAAANNALERPSED